MAELSAMQGTGEGTRAAPQFVHLRVHSAFSLLEGALPVKKIIAKAAADAQPAIGIADTNNLFAALEFSLKCMDEGIQPLIGCQMAIDMEDEGEGDKRGHAQHLVKLPSIVLIAASDAGYAHLVSLVSRAYLDGEGSQSARIALSWLQDGAADGLIALTGAASGPIDGRSGRAMPRWPSGGWRGCAPPSAIGSMSSCSAMGGMTGVMRAVCSNSPTAWTCPSSPPTNPSFRRLTTMTRMMR